MNIHTLILLAHALPVTKLPGKSAQRMLGEGITVRFATPIMEDQMKKQNLLSLMAINSLLKPEEVAQILRISISTTYRYFRTNSNDRTSATLTIDMNFAIAQLAQTLVKKCSVIFIKIN